MARTGLASKPTRGSGSAISSYRPSGTWDEHQALEDRHAVDEEAVVSRQVLRIEQVDAGRVDADCPDAPVMKVIDQFGVQRGEVLAEPGRIGKGAQSRTAPAAR